MQKNYVLDTNVLLHDPKAIFKFEDNAVVIPIYVIEEIDGFKREMSERGRNARQMARYLDELREKSQSTLQLGVELNTAGSLRVAVPKETIPFRTLEGAAMDHAIVRTALEVRDHDTKVPTIFVTMDSNLRIRADALGLKAESYEGARIPADELYTGIVDIQTEAQYVDQLAGKNNVPVNNLGRQEPWFANACVILRDLSQPSHSALGRYDDSEQAIVPLRVTKEGTWGIRPRNVEQWFALDLLLNDKINLLTLVGKAGTGKTLLAIAAGLKKVLDEGAFGRLVVSRPIFPLGRDIGYLPGDLEEKLNPWMQPIFDNLEFIFAAGRTRMADTRNYEELLAAGTLQIEPLTYIRGRSLPNQFLIVDEAQNLTPHEVKTIITRCGHETKIVLTGDPYQIDNPYVDSASNGLSVVAEKFRPERIAGHITLTKGERSELAERATELL